MDDVRKLGDREVTIQFEPNRNWTLSLAAAFSCLGDNKSPAAITEASVQSYQPVMEEITQ